MPRVAVITGASSGIGRAIARALAGDGTALALVGRDVDRLRPVAAAGQDAGSTVRCYAADLGDDRDIAALSENVRRDWPSVDVLVHSAGIISMGRIEQAEVDEFDRQYRVNVRAPYLLTQRLLPLVRACAGQIVFVNSTAGFAARAGVGQYAATKHALKAFADTLRDEVNEAGVRVLTVFLGRTATPMQAAIHDLEGKAYTPEQLVQPEDVAAVIVHALSLPRTAEVTEISIRPLKKPEAARSSKGSR